MHSKPKVYIADLRHTAGGVISNSYMPVGIGYMKAVMDRELPTVESRTFAYPDHLLEALKRDVPDVLMLSNYIWNERLSQHFTKIVKGLRPECLVVAGGPNMTLEKERQIEFFQNWDGLDVYVLGEGDFLATEIVKRFLDAGKSVAKLAKGGIPSSIFRLNGQIIHQEVQNKGRELEKIPSPWLSGVQDHFFDGKLVPMIETNRGCPFKCTFCVQGSDYYDRVAQFPAEQVIEELTYIARRIQKVCPNLGALGIADANFAMFKRDLAISAHIGKLQKDYGWPNYVACSTGKNAPELIVQSMELANGALEMLHAVQSMDENVLQSIKRSNIKLDTYNEVTKHIAKKGVRTFSQVILGLPHETLKGHLNGLRELIDKGIDSMQNLQLVLLKGTDMECQNDREEYGFKTKFRLTIKGFGEYGGTPVFDVEETVTSTNTLSSDDYLKARIFHLGSGVYWNQDWFNDLFYYAQNFGIKFSSCIDTIIEKMYSDDGVMGKFMFDFKEETQAELFTTPEECIRFYTEEKNFVKLARGEIGDNLMNKYRAIASFLIWPQVCQLATKAIKELIVTRVPEKLDPEFDRFWQDLCCFVEAKHAAGQSEDELFSPVTREFQYDIPKWVADGHPDSLDLYKLATPQNFLFQLEGKRASDLKKAIKTFSMDLWGLTKLVRNVKVSCLVRECEKSNDPEIESKALNIVNAG